MSALTIVQDAAGRLGLAVPSVVFSSTDPQVVQLRYLMNQEGREISSRRECGWVQLQTEWNFDTTATAIQTSALPSDFGYILNGTMWDRTSDRPVYGPLNPMEWQREKAGPTFTSVYYAFRIRGTDMLFTPTPASGLTIYYEYATNLWATDSTGADGKTAMTADDDLSKLEDELLTLGVIWRFLRAKGLDFEQAKATYDDKVSEAIAQNGGAPILNLSYTMPYRRYQPNVPEGNWP